MMIHTTLKHLFPIFFATCFIAALTSCGGGGSGGGGAGTSSSSSADSIPNAFTFAPVTNAAVSTEVTSAPVTINGINQSVSISISGGSYSIGGGAFTSATVNVTNGQVVTVKVKSSDKTNTPVTATLTVGGVSAAFTVTTVLDVTPDAFTFTPVTGAGAKAVTSSNEITVTGVDVAVPVSITNGEYSINGAAYTNAAGTVNKDQKITVRATSSDLPSTDVTAVLIIGGVTGNFVVKTKADNAAPTAQILFPPPVSMTEGNTILVRGSASDEFSPIASVRVNGVLAITTDGFKNWQVTVPLTDTTKFVTATTENTLTVTTEDAAENKSTNAARVAIRQAPLTSAFPDAEGYIRPFGLAFDKLDGRNRLLVASRYDDVYSVDLTTGKRTLAFTLSDCSPSTIAVNSLNKHVYAPCPNVGEIIDIDLGNVSEHQTHVIPNFNDVNNVNGNSDAFASILYLKDNVAKYVINYTKYSPFRVEIFAADASFTQFQLISNSEKSIPDTVNPIRDSYGIALDKAADRFLVTDYMQQVIFAVDTNTGARSIFSSNSKGAGELFAEVDSGVLSGIVVDEVNQRALVAEYYESTKIFSIELTTGNRSLLTNTSEANPFNSIYSGFDLKIADPNGYVFVAGSVDKAVFAVDLVTGHRVVFSKYISDAH